MSYCYRVLRSTSPEKAILFGLILFMSIGIFNLSPVKADPPFGAFYYPPDNVPPGPPPNYNLVDTSFFMGEPPLPLPPPDSGGIYVWVDSEDSWNIANHIYSRGTSLEQFHGSVLAYLDSPPEADVNVFATNFELYGDTASNYCYQQNDRWGWYQWAENLYEIWWDVCTREWKQGEGDPNDFMKIMITGCAIDFNVWSSGHSQPFDTDQIFLGASMIRLSDVPDYEDTYPGITDPYQSQAGNDPTRDPNITIFTPIEGIGEAYNKDGLIPSGQIYPCGPVLGEDYGARFSGTLVYEGNGVQFSSSCLHDSCAFNNPPVVISPADTTMIVCELGEICLPGFFSSDPDGNLLSCEVSIGTLTDNTVCFIPVEGINTITLICTDACGAADTAVTQVTVNLNRAPEVTCPEDRMVILCNPGDEVCIDSFFYSDPEGELVSVEVNVGTLEGDTLCFVPVVGVNEIILTVIDDCGLEVSCSTQVTAVVNSPPTITCFDTTVVIPQLEEICLPDIEFTDPDNNIVAIDVTGGYIVDGELCLMPDWGINTVTIVCIDSCDAADSCEMDITVGCCEFTPGDLNGDDSFDLIDVTLLTNLYRYGTALPDTCDCRPDIPTYPFYGAADADGDCSIYTLLDVVYLIGYYRGEIEELSFCQCCPPTGGWLFLPGGRQHHQTIDHRKGNSIGK